MNNIIAIIPARAGSKRIPGKNTVHLLGKPMIAWTIEAALESGIFSDVLVSTDSEEIAALSRGFGATAPFLRNKRDADDYTMVSLATTNALIQMEEYRSAEYDIVVQLMPNCPCRGASDIKSSYDNFISSKNDFQISVFKFIWMNPWWAMKLDEKSQKPVPLFPEALKKRSQELANLYCPTGAVWIAKACLLKREKTFYGKGYRVFPIEWQSAIDIDDEDDFKMAEFILKNREDARGTGP